MNTITASQKNRRERIADAMRIEWEHQGQKYTDTYSTDLWVHLRQAIEDARRSDVFILSEAIYFGGSKHTLTLTELENLCELVRQSYHAQQEAKATR